MLINSFVKAFIMNFLIYYSSNKIMNIKRTRAQNILFIFFDVCIALANVFLVNITNAILLWVLNYVLILIFMKKLLNDDNKCITTTILVGFAISLIAFMGGTILGYIPYIFFFKGNEICGAIFSIGLQILLIVGFFKIKRFKNGLDFLYGKFNNNMENTIIYISICVIILSCLIGNLFDAKEERVINAVITFVILSITMYIMIQRTITMQYKHSLLLKTLEEYKAEIDSKDKEIERLSAEKFNTSKIRHEFYNRQKALELMVKQNISGDIDVNGVSENILNIVNELTAEYSKECEVIKGLNVLPKTDVVEIDNMFKYMQTECAKKNIEFKLNIQDSIHPLINNHISKNRLETLLGDHIRNAINVLDKSDIDDKEILVVLGLKDGNYEICILDNGVEFSIDVLLKLGKEQVTTGGTGIGFLTTFETLKETKASLVITEYESGEYTKAVSFVFNNKCEYVINSYRAKEIMSKNDRKEIIINEI